MDSETIVLDFEKLNLWIKDRVRAPPKLLLILYAIGGLFRGNCRLLPFSDIDDKLGSILSEFGSRQSRQGIQYPFW